MPSLDPHLDDLLAFVHASPTPYHAVAATIVRLSAAGFTVLDETKPWAPLAAGNYFVARAGALVAFSVPDSKTLDGFKIVGAHTDSPNLRLKPNAEYTKEGYRQLGVEVYGGALLNSWLDRDLGLAGRVMVRSGDGIRAELVTLARPLCRIPQLAIHLDREVNEKGLVLNRQEHLPPVLGLVSAGDGGLADLLASTLDLSPSAIAWLDLMLFDLAAPSRGGLNGEFVYSARLDNLAMCHAAISALIAAKESPRNRATVPVAILFDHEEVGSDSAYGAGSPLLADVLERLCDSLGLSRSEYLRQIALSQCVSADMAHALHPNYPDRHEARHRPVLNGGPVIKFNSQQRYATCARTAAEFAELCRQAEVPVQRYSHRTDLPCGSTIGPITATRLGISTIDVGNPMLSMHSVREMAGSSDQAMMIRVMTKFYQQ